MAKVTLYAYVEGNDFEPVVAAIEERLDALVSARKWLSKDVWVVNQQEAGKASSAGPTVIWDLGLNLALAGPRSRPARWVDDLVAIATALGALHQETQRTFVLGVHDEKAGTTSDLFRIETASPDLDRLRAAFAELK